MALSFRTKSIIKIVLLQLLVASTPHHLARGKTATATTMSHRTVKRGLRGGNLRELIELTNSELGPGSGASSSAVSFGVNIVNSGGNASPGEETVNIQDSLPATEPAAEDPVATDPLPVVNPPPTTSNSRCYCQCRQILQH